ncbi:MAG: alanine/ornithine racemase family PLP-dependent enzyme [Thalassospira sp.]|uniref:alanine/ornithine racemase family PLP-dependent enzyme n=1 Tax=Thalassospira sp. TaxID=1912094 RepID=UPI0032F07B48
MSSPRIEIDLDKIFYNAKTLVTRLKAHGISVTGVTKACCGAPQLAKVLLRAGVTSLGDSRIENIERMRKAGIKSPITLIRSPMISQVDRVVAAADISLNTEPDVIRALSSAARKTRKQHGIILMIELGDLREGLMPCDVGKTIQLLSILPNVTFIGLGANLACRNGISPDNDNMGTLSALANRIDGAADATSHPMSVVSGGNSSNLDWVFSGGNIRRINNLRLGEAILLGCDPLHRQPIHGLYTDAIRLTGEVIESKTKPSKPWGTIAQTTFGEPPIAQDVGDVFQAILAIGQQDVDPSGLCPPDGIEVLGASSDHLLLNTGTTQMRVGSEVSFLPDYSALLRAMTSPYVEKTYIEKVEISRLMPQAAPAFVRAAYGSGLPHQYRA